MSQCVMDSGLTAALDMVKCRRTSGQGVIKYKTNAILFYFLHTSLSVYPIGVSILSYVMQYYVRSSSIEIPYTVKIKYKTNAIHWCKGRSGGEGFIEIFGAI